MFEPAHWLNLFYSEKKKKKKKSKLTELRCACAVCLWTYPRKNPQFILLQVTESQRVSERKPKKQKANPRTPAGCCRAANREGHHRQTPSSHLLLPPPLAPHLTWSPCQTADAPHPFRFGSVSEVRFGIFFFFFLFFSSYFVLIYCLVLFLSTA